MMLNINKIGKMLIYNNNIKYFKFINFLNIKINFILCKIKLIMKFYIN